MIVRTHRLRSLLTGAACVIFSALTLAHAQPATYGPGLPMWVVRDDDSTIYITGTVHLLRDEHVWTSSKLEAAFDSSSELWLELAEIADPDSIDEKADRLLRERGAYDGKPISSYLSILEFAAFLGQLKKAGVSIDLETAKRMQPWMAVNALGRGFLAGGVYKTENGIDNALARMAVQRGMPVHGMEELEVQIALVAGVPAETQVAILRSMIRTSPQSQRQFQRVADLAFGGWVRGEVHGAEALMIFQDLAAKAAGQSNDALLKDRNEAWAAVIEEMLARSGTIFIAVGAGHLVGADSLQEQLKLRGIKSERY